MPELRDIWSADISRGTFYFFLSSSVICIALVVLILFLGREVSQKHLQALNWDVASHVAARLSFPDDFRHGTPKVLAELELVHPGTEAYILDSSGKVLEPKSHPAYGKQISLRPINHALQIESPRLPLLGTNPASLSHESIFSVAPLVRGQQKGFVYITLPAASFGELNSLRSNPLRLVFVFLMVMPAFCLLMLAGPAMIVYLRKRLGQVERFLTDAISGDISDLPLPRGRDEVALLCQNIQQQAFEAQQSALSFERLRLERQQLLLDIVHDLRGPLSGLSAAVEILRQPAANHSITEQAVAALREGLTTEQRIVSKLSTLRLLEKNQEDFSLRLLDTAALCTAIVSQQQPRATEAGVSLTLSTDADLPAVVGDVGLLERLFLNLLENAFRYTSRGGRISISLSREESGVSISVSDTGTGIDPVDLSSIFEPFFRSPLQPEHTRGGAGIGLAIVKKIVELHRSQIRVESVLGQGTVFSFSLFSTFDQKEGTQQENARVARSFSWAETSFVTAAVVLLCGVVPTATLPLMVVLGMSCLAVILALIKLERSAMAASVLPALWMGLALISTPDAARGVLFNGAWLLVGLFVVSETVRQPSRRARLWFSALMLPAVIYGMYHLALRGLPAIFFLSGVWFGIAIKFAFTEGRFSRQFLQWATAASLLSATLWSLEIFGLSNYWMSRYEEHAAQSLKAIEPDVQKYITSFSRDSQQKAATSLNFLHPAIDLGFSSSGLTLRPQSIVARTLYRKVAATPLAILFFLGSLAGLLILLALYAFLLRHVQETLLTLRAALSTLSAPGAGGQASSSRREPHSIFASLRAFTSHVHELTRKNSEADLETRDLIMAAASELEGLCRKIGCCMESFGEEGASWTASVAIKEVAALIHLQKILVEILFVLARNHLMAGNAIRSSVALSEVVDDAIIDLAEVFQSRGVYLRNCVPETAVVMSDRSLLHTTMLAAGNAFFTESKNAAELWISVETCSDASRIVFEVNGSELRHFEASGFSQIALRTLASMLGGAMTARTSRSLVVELPHSH